MKNVSFNTRSGSYIFEREKMTVWRIWKKDVKRPAFIALV